MKGHTLPGPHQRKEFAPRERGGMRERGEMRERGRRLLPKSQETKDFMERETKGYSKAHQAVRKELKKEPGRPKMSDAEIAAIKESDAYKTFDQAGNEEKFTSQEHEANKASNATIDQQMLDYKKAYSDKHGSSSGGTDAEWKAYQEGLNKLRSGYVNR